MPATPTVLGAPLPASVPVPKQPGCTIAFVETAVPFGMSTRDHWASSRLAYQSITTKRKDAFSRILEKHGVCAAMQCSVQLSPDDLEQARLPRLLPQQAEPLLCTYLSAISERLHGATQTAPLAISVGGDHSIAIGSIAGSVATHGPLGVVWVDAHADLNTPHTSPTGNIHGMPVAFLLNLVDCSARKGWGWLAELHAAHGTPSGPPPKHAQLASILEPETASRSVLQARGPALLRPEHIVYIGLRDIDSGEAVFLERLGIRAYYMADIARLGMPQILQETSEHFREHLGEGCKIHLSLDVDGLDPSHCPSTGTPVPGGISLKEAARICRHCSREHELVSVDLVEINVGLGSDADVDATLDSVLGMLDSILEGHVKARLG